MNDTIDAQEVPQGDKAIAVRQKQQEIERAISGAPPLQTPQELRTVQVSEVLLPAYQKASTLEISDSEIDALMAPFPDESVEIRPHDGLIYIPHIQISNRLNKVFKPGKWALICRRHWLEGTTMYGEYVLVIRGCYVGESVGGHPYVASNPKTNYSDTLESTAAEALRRICGKRLSCGSQCWEPEYARQWVWNHAQQNRSGKWERVKDSFKPGFKPGATPQSTKQEEDDVPFEAAAPTQPKPEPSAPFPTEESRRKMIAGFGKDPSIALEYFRKLGALLPNENLEDLQLRFVPATKGQMMTLCGKIADFESGSPAQEAYPPHNEPVKSKAEPKPVSGGDEAWRKVIVPIPRKGQKRDEYMKSPDTIGSLYEASSTDDAARKRLFGFVHNWKPEGWNGKPPTDTDIKFRSSLDEFIAWETAKRKEMGEAVQ